MTRTVLLLLASTAFPLSAMAQDASSQENERQVRAEPGDDFHNEIIVTAAGVERLDVIAGTDVVSGIELQRESAGQIGDVLASIPGVTPSGFAPGASRPVLRGFGGERVRVLSDGVGTLDASATSDDHAVAADPLTTERIEVLRGPAVLLYGSQAIGGAVNVISKRIPPRVPDETIHIDALAAMDTASDLREVGASVDVPIGSNFAVHVDGSYRDTNDLEIPGYAASDALRADLLADAAEEQAEGEFEEADELREAANIRGVLPNSYTEATSFGTGAAFFSGDSNFGISYGYYDTTYGVPGAPGAGHAHHRDLEDIGDEEEGEEEEELVSIGLKRHRVDARGVLDLGTGFFNAVQARIGYVDYTHTEFEGEEIGTVFDVEGIEGRLELVQSRRDLGATRWGGATGLQYSTTDFAATGAEAFVPPSVSENIAVFTLQEIDFDSFELEAGARYERASVEALGFEREFDTFSGAIGAGVGFFDDMLVGVNVSRTERAPSAQELFADGPHLATQQFEIGDAELDIESSWGVEAYIRGEVGQIRINASVYRNWFDDFIYLSATGAEEDDLPVFAFMQQDADQWGFEGRVSFPIVQARTFELMGDLRAAYTNAELTDGENLPRIPPLNLLGALETRLDHFDIRAELEWYDEQEQVAPFELPTDGFTLANASVAWHPFEGNENFTLLAQVNNIFDTEARLHTSFTKEFVPRAGRNFRISVRASF